MSRQDIGKCCGASFYTIDLQKNSVEYSFDQLSIADKEKLSIVDQERGFLRSRIIQRLHLVTKVTSNPMYSYIFENFYICYGNNSHI